MKTRKMRERERDNMAKRHYIPVTADVPGADSAANCALIRKTIRTVLELEGVDLTDARFYVLDQQRLLSWAPNANQIENNAVILIEW